MLSTILRSSPKATSNFAKMAAIARISSLQEWEEEWDVLEEETQKFKVFILLLIELSIFSAKLMLVLR